MQRLVISLRSLRRSLAAGDTVCDSICHSTAPCAAWRPGWQAAHKTLVTQGFHLIIIFTTDVYMGERPVYDNLIYNNIWSKNSRSVALMSEMMLPAAGATRGHIFGLRHLCISCQQRGDWVQHFSSKFALKATILELKYNPMTSMWQKNLYFPENSLLVISNPLSIWSRVRWCSWGWQEEQMSPRSNKVISTKTVNSAKLSALSLQKNIKVVTVPNAALRRTPLSNKSVHKTI